MLFPYAGNTYQLPRNVCTRADLYCAFYFIVAHIYGGTFTLRQLHASGDCLRQLAQAYNHHTQCLKPTDCGMLQRHGRDYLNLSTEQ